MLPGIHWWLPILPLVRPDMFCMSVRNASSMFCLLAAEALINETRIESKGEPNLMEAKSRLESS